MLDFFFFERGICPVFSSLQHYNMDNVVWYGFNVSINLIVGVSITFVRHWLLLMNLIKLFDFISKRKGMQFGSKNFLKLNMIIDDIDNNNQWKIKD